MGVKVLLWETIDKLGKLGEVVNVRDGYARNYLFPRKLATADKPSQHRALASTRKKMEKHEAKMVADARALAEQLEKISVSLQVNTTEEGKLYGSVTPTMVSDALGAQGFKIEAKAIDIPDAIKQVGYYEVILNLHRESKPKLKLWVVSMNPDASKPAEAAAPAAPAAEEKK